MKISKQVSSATGPRGRVTVARVSVAVIENRICMVVPLWAIMADDNGAEGKSPGQLTESISARAPSDRSLSAVSDGESASRLSTRGTISDFLLFILVVIVVSKTAEDAVCGHEQDKNSNNAVDEPHRPDVEVGSHLVDEVGDDVPPCESSDQYS